VSDSGQDPQSMWYCGASTFSAWRLGTEPIDVSWLPPTKAATAATMTSTVRPALHDLGGWFGLVGSATGAVIGISSYPADAVLAGSSHARHAKDQPEGGLLAGLQAGFLVHISPFATCEPIYRDPHVGVRSGGGSRA
jgi:hypothetical protein